MVYVLFSNTRRLYAKPGAFIIRLIEGTKFSHVSLAFDSGQELIVSESVLPYKRVIDYTKWALEYELVMGYRIKTTDEQARMVYDYAMSNVSKPYSIAQLVNIAIKRALHFSSKNVNGDKHLICSEHVARALSLIYDIPHIDDYDSYGLLEVKRAIDALVINGLAEHVW